MAMTKYFFTCCRSPRRGGRTGQPILRAISYTWISIHGEPASFARKRNGDDHRKRRLRLPTIKMNFVLHLSSLNTYFLTPHDKSSNTLSATPYSVPLACPSSLDVVRWPVDCIASQESQFAIMDTRSRKVSTGASIKSNITSATTIESQSVYDDARSNMNSAASNYHDASFGRPSMDSQVTINQQETLNSEPTVTLPPLTITYSDATIKGNQIHSTDVDATLVPPRSDSASQALPIIPTTLTSHSTVSADSTRPMEKEVLSQSLSSQLSSGSSGKSLDKKDVDNSINHDDLNAQGENSGHVVIENPDLAHLTEAQRKVVLDQT